MTNKNPRKKRMQQWHIFLPFREQSLCGGQCTLLFINTILSNNLLLLYYHSIKKAILHNNNNMLSRCCCYIETFSPSWLSTYTRSRRRCWTIYLNSNLLIDQFAFPPHNTIIGHCALCRHLSTMMMMLQLLLLFLVDHSLGLVHMLLGGQIAS